MVNLGIVILNWNTRDLLKRCLETVYASEGVFSDRVVVVDNASTDGSAEMVREHFPQAQLIVSPNNGGYSYGNNLGLRALGFKDKGHPLQRSAPDAPRYALLLNPDTEVAPTSLRDMIAFMDSHPEIGAAINRVRAACKANGVRFCVPPEHVTYPIPTDELHATGQTFFFRGSDVYAALEGLRSRLGMMRSSVRA